MTITSAEPSPPAALPERPRRRRPLPLPAWVVIVAALVVAGLVDETIERVRTARDYEAIGVALSAADRADRRVTVLPIDLSERWGDRGVDESTMLDRWTPGNAFFEPLFLAHYDGWLATEDPSVRCYYFPVHDPAAEHADLKVTAVAEFCFGRSSRYPISSGYASLFD